MISKLLPFKSKIEEFIQQGVIFLFTGNAMEIMEDYIENEDYVVLFHIHG